MRIILQNAVCLLVAVLATPTRAQSVPPPALAQSVPMARTYIPHAVTMPSGVPGLCLVTGDTLHFTQSFTNDDYDGTFLEVDHRVVARTPLDTGVGEAASCAYDWRASGSGLHTLRLGLSQLHGGYVRQPELTVQVVPMPPVQLVGLPLAGVNDVPLTAQVVPSAFIPVRAVIRCDGELLPSVSGDPFRVNLPLSHLAAGSHTVHLQAYDVQGNCFVGPDENVTVLERAEYAGPPQFTILHDGDTFSMSANLTDGVHVARLTYLVDGKALATAEAPPYQGKVDLNGLAEGTHRVMVRLTTSEGQTFDAPPSEFTLTNKPEEDRQAAIAVAEAKAVQAQAEAAQAEADRKERLKQQAIANTEAAIQHHQVSIVITSNLRKVESEDGTHYYLSIKVTNNSAQAVGPFFANIVFDDFSTNLLLPYDLAQYSGEGYPIHFISDSDLVIPGSSSREYSYIGIAYSRSSAPETRKAVRVELYNGLSVLLNP